MTLHLYLPPRQRIKADTRAFKAAKENTHRKLRDEIGNSASLRTWLIVITSASADRSNSNRPGNSDALGHHHFHMARPQRMASPQHTYSTQLTLTLHGWGIDGIQQVQRKADNR